MLKTKKTKIHVFESQLYPIELHIILNSTSEYIEKNYKTYEKDDDLKLKQALQDCEALTVKGWSKLRKKYAIIICLTESKKSVSLIAHEASHAADFIWQHIGEDSTGMEAHAYLVGWCAECIEKSK